MDGCDTMCELLEMFFPGQAQDPVHRTCLGKCEIWSDTASNVDSIRVSLYGKPREFREMIRIELFVGTIENQFMLLPSVGIVRGEHSITLAFCLATLNIGLTITRIQK